MRETQLIDINAHICDLSASVDIEKSQAIISFCNLAYGTITAVKLQAKGYNSFGDVVLVQDKETFSLVIQDLDIPKYNEASAIKVPLPSPEIRKLELTEKQVCFLDGSIATYEGPNMQSITFDSLDSISNGDSLFSLAICDILGEEAKYVPEDFEFGWLCTCGQVNVKEKTSCSNCDNSKANVFKVKNDDEKNIIVNNYKEKIRVLEEQQKQEAIKAAKEKKKKQTKIAVGVVAGVVALILVVYATMMGNRKTFSSEEEMRKYVQGTYTHYRDGVANMQYIISGNTGERVFKYLGGGSPSEIRKWDYKHGKFQTFEDVIVLSNGDIKVDGDLYKKGGYMDVESLLENHFESGYSALQITNLAISTNSSYTICTGAVKNTGSKTYSFVEVKGAFKDESGTVVDTDWTYAVGSEGLAPGESSTFRLSVTKNYNITSCSVSILDYD